MIQPFVENAIIHGIKKKEGEGKIDILFFAKENILICEIIWRCQNIQPAVVIIVKKPGRKSSNREQLKIQSGHDAGVEIIDLKDEKGKPTGTKVIVSIPFEMY